ncbi:hypothetical protein MtrunA17_Chr5g0438011 [Medicago truncatula]|uniref:Sororin C-terminal region domain-containing protein n=1 Tax=Medicago truncatula TaxID=3880 RepID=G7KH16_MEDTR|nr:uncharacterized protein LOC11419950 [Medicago truncatula]AES99704.1 hypothetical protein MTR_5g083840 [Medicago truncatula]RHN57220.1 hypothetical protein MtrunA17_Chr5g0438011 [Medicago truncatula]
MESERKRKRNPLSDRTNTFSSVPPKSTKPKTNFTSTTANLNVASNRISVAPEFLSTPLPNTRSRRGTVDGEASKPISVVYSIRNPSNKRKEKEKEKESVIRRKEVETPSSRTPVDRWKVFLKGKGVDIASSSTSKDISNEPTIPCKKQPTTKFTTTTAENLDVASSRSSVAPDFLSTHFPNPQPRPGTVDLEASRKEKENESVIQRKEVDTLSSRIPVDRWYTYSKEMGVDIVSSRTSNQREDKEKRVDTASSSIPMDMRNEPTIPCKKQPTTKFTTTTENLNVASDSSSDEPDFLSTPFPNTRPCHGTVDLEASAPISIVFGRRNSSNKRKEKENASDSPAGSVPIKKNGKNKGKDKGRDKVDIPSSITPMDRWNKPANSNTIKRKDKSKSTSRVCNTREKSANPPKAKASSVPCRKKQRAKPSLVNVYKDPAVQDYIKKQNAYFKMIDEFELSEEEVDSISDS